MEIPAWPRSSWTCFGCLPAMSSIVAQVWRRSWNLKGGRSAFFKRGLNWRPRRLVALVVVPVSGIPPLARTRLPYATLASSILSSSKSAGLM
jgi:hypothetical protein